MNSPNACSVEMCARVSAPPISHSRSPVLKCDVECFVCGGKGCPACGSKGWIEIAGCGLTHPVVLQNGGYDPDIYTGFAAGLGIERISMLRYRIDDIRNFWRNDIRFLEQF